MTNPLATVLVVGDEVCSIEAIQRVLSDGRSVHAVALSSKKLTAS